MLRVAYAREWSSSREKTSAGISEVVRPFDWSYSAAYLGDEVRGGDGRGLEREGPAREIPVELLKRRDPILFADEVVLYESELDDNGISVMSVKVRVMEQRMLLLCRLYMRLDGVVVRVRDTRVYVDFQREEVIREYTAREDVFENVKRVCGLLFFFWRTTANETPESLHERADAGRHHDRFERLEPGRQPAACCRALAGQRLLGDEGIGHRQP
jgi:hypothetical protein